MATAMVIEQVRTGMPVNTADGQTLGKVERVWFGDDPSAPDQRYDDEVCSRLEVHHGFLVQHRVLYIPASAIAEVTDGHVTLTMDASTAATHNWIKQPAWIAAASGRPSEPLDDTSNIAGNIGLGPYNG